MKRILNYDPLTRETIWFESDGDKVFITHTQELDEHLDFAQALANDNDQTARGIKSDMWRYAHVPNTIIMDMKERFGVDFFDNNDAPKMFDLLNTEYSRFKTTSKVHKIRHG